MVSVDRDGLVIWISVQRGLFPAQIAMSLNEAATLMAQIESALALRDAPDDSQAVERPS